MFEPLFRCFAQTFRASTLSMLSHSPYWLKINHLLIVCLATAGIGFSAINAYAAEPMRVVIPRDENPDLEHIQYFYKLLDLALHKTQDAYGPYELVEFAETTNYERYLQYVQNGTIDVLWTNTDPAREAALHSVPISLLKDLNSYRIFFIRDTDQELFHNVKTLADLRRFRAGQGTTWPDTQVLRNNDLPVVTAMRQDSLIKMLASNRFDYYPRGLYEIWREEKSLREPHIVIEDSVMIYYPSPVYYFVNKQNTLLAERLEKGLKLAQEDGSFDQLFFAVKNFNRGYQEQHSGKRKIITLSN